MGDLANDFAAPPRYVRHRSAAWSWILVALLLIAARCWWGGTSGPPPTVLEGTYRVRQVVDGDTLVLENGAVLRLQGIDTPETVHPDLPPEPWGAEATVYTRQFVADADSRVQVTMGSERLDRYGRHIAYVWNRNRLLNEELVNQGLAETRPNYPQSDTMKRRLNKALLDAQQAKRGMWRRAVPGEQRS